jgi:hypothetical protein
MPGVNGLHQESEDVSKPEWLVSVPYRTKE